MPGFESRRVTTPTEGVLGIGDDHGGLPVNLDRGVAVTLDSGAKE